MDTWAITQIISTGQGPCLLQTLARSPVESFQLDLSGCTQLIRSELNSRSTPSLISVARAVAAKMTRTEWCWWIKLSPDSSIILKDRTSLTAPVSMVARMQGYPWPLDRGKLILMEGKAWGPPCINSRGPTRVRYGRTTGTSNRTAQLVPKSDCVIAWSIIAIMWSSQ